MVILTVATIRSEDIKCREMMLYLFEQNYVLSNNKSVRSPPATL
jgi:hypothetical protein